MNKGCAITGCVIHVDREAMEIAYKHDDLGRALYEQNVALGFIKEDLI